MKRNQKFIYTKNMFIVSEDTNKVFFFYVNLFYEFY